MKSKWLSRKFLISIAAIVAEILIGLGYEVDPEVLIQIAGATAGLYILVEGLIDALKGGGK